MKKMKLTREEINGCQKLVEQFAETPSLVDQKLTELGKNPKETRQQIEEGVAAFYKLYSGEVNQKTILNKLQKTMEGMSSLQKYCYLANLMTALSTIEGKVFGDDTWEKKLEDYQTILTAIKMGIIQEDDSRIADCAEEMMDIVSENIAAFSVLFVDNPDLVQLQEACLTENTEQVKAVALNTRETAANMASAVYIMQESGRLPSLGDTHYSARDIGVMSASILEIDAAQKTGSEKTAKSVFQKASRTAVTLLMASPSIVAGLSVFTIIAALTNFSTLGMIVSGVAIGLNLKVHYDLLAEKVSPILNWGGKVLNTALGVVKPIYSKITSWVQNTVVPNAMSIWRRCCDFTCEHILIPAATFVLKAWNAIHNSVRKAAHKIGNLYKAAQNIAQQDQEVVVTNAIVEEETQETEPEEETPVQEVTDVEA